MEIAENVCKSIDSAAGSSYTPAAIISATGETTATLAPTMTPESNASGTARPTYSHPPAPLEPIGGALCNDTGMPEHPYPYNSTATHGGRRADGAPMNGTALYGGPPKPGNGTGPAGSPG